MAPAPAQEPLVLKLPHLDHSAGQPDFVLVGVSSEGRRPLDLKLIGTENETVFSVSCKDRPPRAYPWPSFHALSRELIKDFS